MKNVRSIRSTLIRAASGLAMAVGVAGAAVAVVPTPAVANPQGSALVRVINNATNKCLDSRGGDVYTKTCTGNNNQHWVMVTLDGGQHVIFQNLATARCLDSNAAGRVYTNPCNTKNHYQQWRLTSLTMPYTFVSRATGRALDSNFHKAGHPDRDLGDVYTLPRNGGNHQNWRAFK
ncbi:RICIN domain-containing protein [Micromonospora sp. SH-82]|uniref:RICIN domain-containing protein n=1 Tax=Micromonospora sp. SH-82 TaxID=3132938 RepID=UPI003EB6AEBC